MSIVWCQYHYLLEISNKINRILEEDSNMAVKLLQKEAQIHYLLESNTPFYTVLNPSELEGVELHSHQQI